MYRIVLLLMIITLSSHAGIGDIAGGNSRSGRNQRGIGDIAGGNSREVKRLIRASKHLKNDRIHFQEASLWSSIIYSKTLCFDGHEFRIRYNSCTKWKRDSDDDRKCLEYKMITISQPQESTRMRCKKRNDDKCIEWEEVKYIQNDILKVKFLDESRSLIAEKYIKIPSCYEKGI